MGSNIILTVWRYEMTCQERIVFCRECGILFTNKDIERQVISGEKYPSYNLIINQ